MSLQSGGACTIPNKAADSRELALEGQGTNYIGDIQGARPTEKMNRFTDKPNFYNVNDIKGTRPLTLHRAINAVDYTLKCDDIEGSRPRGQSHKAARSNNPIDPLMPAYKLPSYSVPDDPTPKFLRDTLDIADIDGTRAKPLYKYPTRENYKVDDIEGAKAGWKPRHRRVGQEGTPRDIMAVADINDQGVKKSTRCTDPLRPVHYINGMQVQDDMKYTMPTRLPPQRDGPFLSLTTADIEGAYPGWNPPHAMQPPIEQRRHFRNTNFVGDIAGAQSDTVMHCIKTNRVTNPLNPNYTSLDGDNLDGVPLKNSQRDDEAMESLQYAMTNATNQEAAYVASRSSSKQFTNTAEFRDINSQRSARQSARSSRQPSPQPQTDERDARIQRLEAEIYDLRSTGAASGRPPMEMSKGFSAPSPGGATQYRQPSPGAAFYQSQQGGSRGPSPRGTPQQSRGPSPALSARSGGGNGALVLTARSGNSASAERMILRSSDGAPRVNMTPREVKQARAYQDDVASVRDL